MGQARTNNKDEHARLRAKKSKCNSGNKAALRVFCTRFFCEYNPGCKGSR